MTPAPITTNCLRTWAILTTATACLGAAGFFTIVGLDLLRSYEASGMLSGYIASVCLFGVSTVTTVPLWVAYSRHRTNDVQQYETI